MHEKCFFGGVLTNNSRIHIRLIYTHWHHQCFGNGIESYFFSKNSKPKNAPIKMKIPAPRMTSAAKKTTNKIDDIFAILWALESAECLYMKKTAIHTGCSIKPRRNSVKHLRRSVDCTVGRHYFDKKKEIWCGTFGVVVWYLNFVVIRRPASSNTCVTGKYFWILILNCCKRHSIFLQHLTFADYGAIQGYIGIRIEKQCFFCFVLPVCFWYQIRAVCPNIRKMKMKRFSNVVSTYHQLILECI